jgi:hypothetical protein
LAEIDPSGISRAPHAQPFQRPRDANERRVGRAAETVLAGPVTQATCLAELPLLHSTLEPTAIRELQQWQTDAKRAVMTIGSSHVVFGRHRTAVAGVAGIRVEHVVAAMAPRSTNLVRPITPATLAISIGLLVQNRAGTSAAGACDTVDKLVPHAHILGVGGKAARRKTMGALFDSVSVNMATGVVTYAKLPRPTCRSPGRDDDDPEGRRVMARCMTSGWTGCRNKGKAVQGGKCEACAYDATFAFEANSRDAQRLVLATGRRWLVAELAPSSRAAARAAKAGRKAYGAYRAEDREALEASGYRVCEVYGPEGRVEQTVHAP